jgi:hypothetical protein
MYITSAIVFEFMHISDVKKIKFLEVKKTLLNCVKDFTDFKKPKYLCIKDIFGILELN